MQDKFKRVNIVSDQIQTWARRVYGKFAKQGGTEQSQDLVGMFSAMGTQV